MAGGRILFLLTMLIIFVLETQAQVQYLEYTISEELSPRTLVGNIAHDAGLHKIYTPAVTKQLDYSIVREGERHASLFTITKEGLLKTTSLLDREDLCLQAIRCSLPLSIKVGPVRYFLIIKVNILLLDVNDNYPKFPNATITRFIAETSMAYSTFSIPVATDLDSPSFGIIRYELKSVDHHFSLLQTEAELVVLDLQVVLRKKLDRETKEKHTFKVTAYDRGAPSLSASMFVTVVVLDSNDNSPVFENDSYHMTVSEDILPTSKILQVTATDTDHNQNAEIAYSLSSRTVSSVGHIFNINNTTGEIYVTGKLDYETTRSYCLTVIARNIRPGAASGVTKVYVDVIDINDTPPTINFPSAENRVEISEYIHPGDFVAHMTVKDLDSGNGGKFNCSLSSDAFSLQRLLATDFKIIANRKFDREVESEVNLTLVCTDNGLPSLTATHSVTVFIRDENDNTPQFVKSVYYVNIKENNEIGRLLLQIRATDNDTGINSNIKYSIKNTKQKLFNVDPDSGNVTIQTVLDFEQTNEIYIKVVATDHGQPPLSAETTVVINVIDVDDEKPMFSKSMYFFQIEEHSGAGASLGTIHAVDADSPPFDRFIYVIDPFQNDSNLIHVDAKTGLLSTRFSLDREVRPYYNITVMAVSKVSYHPSTSTTIVRIQVVDVNDNAPYFIFPSFHNNTINLSRHHKVGRKFGQLIANDLDIGSNARLSYSIQAANTNDVVRDVIQVEPDTGYLLLARSVDNEIISFTIQPTVNDNGVPAKSARTLLNINIMDVPSPEAYTKLSKTGDSNVVILICIGVVAGLVIVILILVIAVIYRRRTIITKIKRPCTPPTAINIPTTEGSEHCSIEGALANRETLLRQSWDESSLSTLGSRRSSRQEGSERFSTVGLDHDDFRLCSSFPLIYKDDAEHLYKNSEQILRNTLPPIMTPITRQPHLTTQDMLCHQEEIDLHLRQLDQNEACLGIPQKCLVNKRENPCYRAGCTEWLYTALSESSSISGCSRPRSLQAENLTQNRLSRKMNRGHYHQYTNRKSYGSESSMQTMERRLLGKVQLHHTVHFSNSSDSCDAGLGQSRSFSDSGVDHQLFREESRKHTGVSTHPQCPDNDSGVAADLTNDNNTCSTSTMNDTQPRHMGFPRCSGPAWNIIAGAPEYNGDVQHLYHVLQDRRVVANPAIFVKNSFKQTQPIQHTCSNMVQDWLDNSETQATVPSQDKAGHVIREQPLVTDILYKPYYICEDIHEEEENNSSNHVQHSDVDDTDVIIDNVSDEVCNVSDVTDHSSGGTVYRLDNLMMVNDNAVNVHTKVANEKNAGMCVVDNRNINSIVVIDNDHVSNDNRIKLKPGGDSGTILGDSNINIQNKVGDCRFDAES